MKTSVKLIVILIMAFCMAVNTALAGENDLYDFLWIDKDKEVFVLQNKLHPKDKSFYFDLGYVRNQSATFQKTSGVSLNTGYYFKEEWAIELNYTQYANTDNSALQSLKSISGTIPFMRNPLEAKSLYVIWSPFYGKINTFNKIYYFDWSFGAGLGSLKMESNLKSSFDSTKNTFEIENYTPIYLKTNFKFHINKFVNIGIEYRSANYQANTPKNINKKTWTMNDDLVFSVGVSF